MWHEAKKQERRIRGMIVDYRKRAERRQDFYERIQADPTQFIQVHGRRCKIYIDAPTTIGDSASIIVPWQGHEDNLIDRFDVRAHLEIIPSNINKYSECSEITSEERLCNYERYRILAQNDFLNLSEEKFLYQLNLEEQFGTSAHSDLDRSGQKKKPGAKIGYTYSEGDISHEKLGFLRTSNSSLITHDSNRITKSENDSESDSMSDLDIDVSIEITKLDNTQAHELNACGRNYGMMENDFYSFLTKDADEAEALRAAREEEQEKVIFSGRKSRRERRAHKEKKIACRPRSPPSYAAKDEKNKVAETLDDSSSSSTDENTEKITYITSFGEDDNIQSHHNNPIDVDMLEGPHPMNVNKTLAKETGRKNVENKKGTNLPKAKDKISYFHMEDIMCQPLNPKDSSYKNSATVRNNETTVKRHMRMKSQYELQQYHVKPDILLPRVHPFDNQMQLNILKKSPPPPIKRYYGRKNAKSSSDTDIEDETECNFLTSKIHKGNFNNGSKPDRNSEVDLSNSIRLVGNSLDITEEIDEIYGNVTTANGTDTFKGNANQRERLKRKMQSLLNKQYKADKKAEIKKSERDRKLQQEREDEMRELALKLRRRQRQLRHKYSTQVASCYDSGTDTSHHEMEVDMSSRSNESISDTVGGSNHLISNSLSDSCQASNLRQNPKGRSCVQSNAPYFPMQDPDPRFPKRSNSRCRTSNAATNIARTESSSDDEYHKSLNKFKGVKKLNLKRKYSSERCSENPERRTLRFEKEGAVQKASSVTEYRTNESRIIIAAPPKLKKLVDY